MRINENTQIVGKNVTLVPYEAKHVAKYHEWMKSSELQELTKSEPLTLDEEYAMQKSWREDEDKLTFLVLSRSEFETTNDEIKALVGDTNLFLGNSDDGFKVAEAEIMISSIGDRGKGFGKEAMLQMLRYAVDLLGIEKFQAKIGIENEKSIRMFEKIGFEEEGRSEVFKEVTLAKIVDNKFKVWLHDSLEFKEKKYVE